MVEVERVVAIARGGYERPPDMGAVQRDVARASLQRERGRAGRLRVGDVHDVCSVLPADPQGAADGDLVELSPGYYLHADVDRGIQDTLRETLADGNGATLSEIREVLNTTRKYAVPYCEYLDRIGFTRREGDLRYVANPEKD